MTHLARFGLLADNIVSTGNGRYCCFKRRPALFQQADAQRLGVAGFSRQIFQTALLQRQTIHPSPLRAGGRRAAGKHQIAYSEAQQVP